MSKQRRRNQQQGSALLVALLSALAISITVVFVLQMNQNSEEFSRLPRIKSAMSRIETTAIQQLYSGNMVIACAEDPNQPCVNHPFVNTLKAKIYGKECAAKGGCFAQVENARIESGRLLADVTYSGDGIAVKPLVVSQQLTQEMWRTNIVRCPLATPFMTGLKPDGTIECASLPAGCGTGQFMQEFDLFTLSTGLPSVLKCSQITEEIRCPAGQFLGSLNWNDSTGQVVGTCRAYVSAFSMTALGPNPISTTTMAPSNFTQPVWPASTTTTTTTTLPPSTSSTSTTTSTTTTVPPACSANWLVTEWTEEDPACIGVTFGNAAVNAIRSLSGTTCTYGDAPRGAVACYKSILQTNIQAECMCEGSTTTVPVTSSTTSTTTTTTLPPSTTSSTTTTLPSGECTISAKVWSSIYGPSCESVAGTPIPVGETRSYALTGSCGANVSCMIEVRCDNPNFVTTEPVGRDCGNDFSHGGCTLMSDDCAAATTSTTTTTTLPPSGCWGDPNHTPYSLELPITCTHAGTCSPIGSMYPPTGYVKCNEPGNPLAAGYRVYCINPTALPGEVGGCALSVVETTTSTTTSTTTTTLPVALKATCKLKGPGDLASGGKTGEDCDTLVYLKGDSGVVTAKFMLNADPVQFSVSWSGDCVGTGVECIDKSQSVSSARPERFWTVNWSTTNLSTGAVQTGTIEAYYGEK